MQHGQTRLFDMLTRARCCHHETLMIKITIRAAVQKGTDTPVWVRLTPDDRARLDGTAAAQGRGRWRLREAQEARGLSKAEVWQKARHGALIA